MINFTVGPVQSEPYILDIGKEQIPYFRTPEFSAVMKENERLMKKFSGASEDARVVFLTGSGTAAMEAAVMNSFNQSDKVLVVDGGSFGHRFAQICEIHQIPYEEIKLPVGKALKSKDLEPYEGRGFTGFLVNLDETSTGVLYDIQLISGFCKRNNLYLIVDAISSFISDKFEMEKMGVDIMLTGSQKALAVPPGVSIVVMSPHAVDRIEHNNVKCLYLNLKIALKDGERGQTPFTPAVGTLLQINARLKEIDKIGIDEETAKIKALAQFFREKIKDLPFEMVSESMPNAVTPLAPKNVSAYSVFVTLKDEYGIWVCPNGGELADKMFRVGHIGALTEDDYTKLIDALKDMEKRGLL